MKRFTLFLSLLSLACSSQAPQTDKEASMSLPDLRKSLAAKAAASADQAPEEKQKLMLSAIEDLRQSNIKAKALKVGDKVPALKLPSASEETVALNDLIAQGPIVLTFYRGGWCPYCNITLRAYQDSLPEFKKYGAQLVAISPDLPDNSLSTKEKNSLEFYVLSDSDNRAANRFGLVYALPEDLKKLYLEFGINLEEATGSKSWELPVSATYVIDQSGKIVFAHFDEDYKKRAQPEDIVEALRSL